MFPERAWKLTSVQGAVFRDSKIIYPYATVRYDFERKNLHICYSYDFLPDGGEGGGCWCSGTPAQPGILKLLHLYRILSRESSADNLRQLKQCSKSNFIRQYWCLLASSSHIASNWISAYRDFVNLRKADRIKQRDAVDNRRMSRWSMRPKRLAYYRIQFICTNCLERISQILFAFALLVFFPNEIGIFEKLRENYW